MVSSTASAIVSEHLNVDNYEYWSGCVKTYLLAEGLWEVVEANCNPPEDGDDACNWHRQNAKALHVILISCGSASFPVISDATSAGVAWDLLARKFRPVYYYNNQSDPTPVDGGRRVQHEESLQVEEQEEPVTTGHENVGANIVALEEAFGALSNLDKIMEFIRQNPEAIRMRHPTKHGWTALHMAVYYQDAEAVEELLLLMEKEDLEIKDDHGRTAFFYTMADTDRSPNLNIVECLHRKNNALVSDPINVIRYKNVLPVIIAISQSNWELAECFYRLTPKETLKPENGHNGADIITGCIVRKKFDIAWDLIQRYPRLVITEDYSGTCPLYLLAGMRSAFKSGTPLTFWQRWIYDCINIKIDLIASFGARKDVQTHEYDEENQMEQIDSAKLPLWQQIWSHCAAVGNIVEEVFMAVFKVFGIYDRVYQKKHFHVHVLHLLKCMAQVLSDGNVEQMSNSVVQTAIFRAIQCGLVEFVDGFLVKQKEYADVMAIRDKRGRNALAFAVECRREKIYNLIRENFEDLDGSNETLDNIENSLLHIVGTLSPSVQFNHIRDAALQMQRELHWLKEMESFVSPSYHEVVNYEDNMTGRELFTKNHKELVKEGEKSMKETATSCSIAGALIVTMMFASAFTIVGGNNENTGLPVLLDNKLFMVFIVSDTLSLFSSTTSVMIFLGILTSRYQESDFLKSLPAKMMVGLLALLFSIATMMVAFSTTLIIMLHDKYPWIVAPIIVLACLPITSFVWMQYPLLVEICVSTYGPGIFCKRRSHSRRQAVKKFYDCVKGKVASAFSLKLKTKV